MAGFQKAKREQVWLKLLLSGAAGSGKSFSALRLAKGIADSCNGAIAYIGTEGSRDRYYSNEFDYDLLQLEAPFTSEKYIEAIHEAVEGGYKILIIDSLSHEWKWLNEEHDKMPGNSFTNWGKLKPRHAKLVEEILQSPIHIIATARGKDEWVLEDNNGKQVPKKVGMGTQQDKDIAYEFTVSFMIDQSTHIAVSDKDNTKLFDKRYEVLTEKDGVALYKWANDGEIPAPKQKPAPAPEYGSMEDELTGVQNEIIQMAKEKGGQKNRPLMAILKEYASNGNPKAIKDIGQAREALERITVIEGV